MEILVRENFELGKFLGKFFLLKSLGELTMDSRDSQTLASNRLNLKTRQILISNSTSQLHRSEMKKGFLLNPHKKIPQTNQKCH